MTKGKFGLNLAAATKPKTRTAAASAQTQAAPVQTQYAPSAQPPVSFQTPPTVTQDAPTPVPRLCPACSAPLHEDSVFCTECGAKTE